MVLLVATAGSQWERTLEALFPEGPSGTPKSVTPLRSHPSLSLLNHATLLIEELGLPPDMDQSDAEWLETELGGNLSDVDFPSTKGMAELAWKRAGGPDHPPDEQLIRWMEAETRLFYLIEDAQATPRFRECATTEAYMSLAKSLLQRRSSRRGRSLELHLERIFKDHRLRVDAQAQVESGGGTVDFIFPGIAEYHDKGFPAERLFHMNAKTTIRERWSQVLEEAPKVLAGQRHIGTVDANIASSTLARIHAEHLRVVMPEGVISGYSNDFLGQLMPVSEFIERVRKTQE